MIIDEATVADIPALLRLINGAYRGDGSRRGWTTEADLLGGQRTDADDLLTRLQTPGAVILTLREADSLDLLGCVYLEPQRESLYLGMLTVRPDRQAAGLGRQLLAAAEAHARQLDLPAVKMTVITARSELLAWYERHGYRRTGRVLPFPDDPRFGLPRQVLAMEVLRKELGG